MIIGTGRHAYISSIIPILNDLNIQNCIQMNECICIMHELNVWTYLNRLCRMSKFDWWLWLPKQKWFFGWIKKYYYLARHNFDIRHIAESTTILLSSIYFGAWNITHIRHKYTLLDGYRHIRHIYTRSMQSNANHITVIEGLLLFCGYH